MVYYSYMDTITNTASQPDTDTDPLLGPPADDIRGRVIWEQRSSWLRDEAWDQD